MSSSTMRPLPASIETERLVLGGIMVTSGAMATVRQLLEPEDFDLEAHRLIWSAICRIYDHGNEPDRASVASALMEKGDLQAAGGMDLLMGLDDRMPFIVNFDGWIKTLKAQGARRRLIQAAGQIEKRAMLGDDPQEIIESASQMLMGMKPTNGTPSAEWVRETIQRVGLNKLLAPRRERGLRLPWPQLDSALCGIHPGQLIILAAHRSYGKTSMALQIARAVAKQDKTALVFSLEMEKERLIQRMVTQIAHLDFNRSRLGVLNEESKQRQRDAANWLNGAPIRLVDRALSVPAIHAEIRRTRMEAEIGVVVVDYLQLIQSTGRSESRAKEVGANSRALKLAAVEFGVPFVVLSQFNRDSARDGRRPELHDLKESGDIENDADVVLLLHPENPKDPGEVQSVTAIVAKQREGPRNIEVPMLFMSPSQRFEEAYQSNERASD